MANDLKYSSVMTVLKTQLCILLLKNFCLKEGCTCTPSTPSPHLQAVQNSNFHSPVRGEWGFKTAMDLPLILRALFCVGNVNLVDWNVNDGMERWSGLLEWSTGLDYWSATILHNLSM